MELINGIQIEVTEITIKKQSLLNKRNVFFFKRRIFLADIKGVSEENYLVENNYSRCASLYIEDEGWIKIREPFDEVSAIHSEWWRAKTSESLNAEPTSLNTSLTDN